jgi:hypothetical protein
MCGNRGDGNILRHDSSLYYEPVRGNLRTMVVRGPGSKSGSGGTGSRANRGESSAGCDRGFRRSYPNDTVTALQSWLTDLTAEADISFRFLRPVAVFASGALL